MRTLLTLIALLPAGLRAAEVEVQLVDGERVFGALVADHDGSLTVDRLIWHPGGTTILRGTWSRSRVRRIEVVGSLQELYRERAAEAGSSYDERYSLAHWCLERGLQPEAFAVAEPLWRADPQDAVTRQLLVDIGYMLDGDRWLSRVDYAAQHGLVSFEGKLMSSDEADARKRRAAAIARLEAAEKRIADLEVGTRKSLDGLRTATVAAKRAQRHERQQEEATEKARRERMSDDDLADEQEARRFDQEHHVEKPTDPEPKEVADTRSQQVAAQGKRETREHDLKAARAERDLALAERDELANRIAALGAARGER